ncbi:MAG: hypothetical protein U0570_10135 [Phycisphaerales bacterium]
MNNLPSNLPFDPDMLDRYLDGAMSTVEAAAFEQQIARSPEMLAQVRLQREVDGSLRDSFSVPATGGLMTESEQRAFAPKKERRGWSRETKMFASLAALLIIAVSIQAYIWVSSPGSAPERPSLAQAYYQLVNHGFRPSEECTTPEKFAMWTNQRYQVPLALKENRPEVQLVGWSYSSAISNYTGLLLAKVDGKPVVVALDTIDRQNNWGVPCRRQPKDETGVNFFSAELDGLILYEITPFDRPRIIDNLAVLKR